MTIINYENIGHIPYPFANSAELNRSIFSTTGIDILYATPIDNNGKYFSRSTANALGFLSTFSLFLCSIGKIVEYINGIVYNNSCIVNFIDYIHCLKQVKPKLLNPSSPKNNTTVLNNEWDWPCNKQIIADNIIKTNVGSVFSNANYFA